MSSGPWPPRASGEEDDEARRPLPAASARALSRVGARYSSAPVARRRADAARGRSGGDSGDAPDGDAPEPADRKAAAVRGGAARRRPMPRRAARVVGGAIWIPTHPDEAESMTATPRQKEENDSPQGSYTFVSKNENYTPEVKVTMYLLAKVILNVVKIDCIKYLEL